MRILYTIGLYLSVPFVLIKLWWRGRINPEYRNRIAERFGILSPLTKKPRIWLHAVSVGETIAATPLIKKLLTDYPDYSLLVTTTTPTGSAQLMRLFGGDVEHVYFPYDLPYVIKRFLSRVRPEILIIMETELWPNLCKICSHEKIPVLISNARLSPKSFTGYRKILPLIRTVFADISMISPQSEADAERFLRLGAVKSQIHICGNLKFDLQIPVEVTETGELLKSMIGNRPVWIAASTHDGEDEQILDTHRKVIEQFPGTLLILVPRHPERFNVVARLCEERNFTIARRSKNLLPDNSHQIYLGDTMGELLQLYSSADIAFVGGSLVPSGGHNPLEPAALGLPVLSGNYVFNFLAIIETMQEENAIKIVHDSDELAETLIDLFQQPDKRSLLGIAGSQLIEKNRGATACILNEIEMLIKQ